MNQIKLLELVALSQIEGIGPQKLKYLIKVTQNCQSIWEIDQHTLEKIIGPKLVPDFLSAGQHFNAQEILGQIEQSKSEAIFIEDDNYPQALKEITDAPPILFVRGNIGLLKILPKKLAVVGSRKYSQYGRMVVESLIPDLARSGLVIVSGFNVYPNEVEDVIVAAINWLAGIVATVAILMVLGGGVVWVTAGGEEDRVKSARKWIIAGLAGLALALGAFIIVRVIVELFT